MKRIFRIMFSVMLMGALLVGNSAWVRGAAVQEKNSYYIYYVNGEETDLQRTNYAPQEETADYMLQDLMQRLNDKNEESKTVDLLPAEVQMNSYKIEDVVLTIDFNSAYLEMSRVREILVRAGVVKIFIQVPGISAVQFTVEGEELTDSKGQTIGQMTAASFVEVSDSDTDSYCYDTFTLYFTDKTGKKLVEEKRNVYYRRNIPKERVVLEQLAKGPMVKGHYPTIPENMEVLSITTADDTCFLDVSQAFLDYALDGLSQKIPVYSLVNSLLSMADASRVQITVNGQEDATFGKNLSLYQFFERNDALVTAEKEN